LVPATTVPVTIIGAFAGMAALGYTVNLSTLFALILAIGIVVDDAIVIVEGVSKHIEQGMSGHDAAIKAMDELFGPIIGITLVLMAVFLPSAFVPGLSGQMFAQFALVIAVTALISAVNAATLKPTQCALWLRTPVPPEQRNFFYRGFNRLYQVAENAYTGLIGRMVRLSGLMVLIGLALFLTIFIMRPVGERLNTQVIQPYLAQSITTQAALQQAVEPLRDFMLRQTREHDLALFIQVSGAPRPNAPADVPLTALLPAFVISELRTAFQIGFLLYLPFLVLDLVISSLLVSMGMMMLPQTLISLPFKLMLFVLVDGWNLIVSSLVRSFQ